MVNNKSKTKEKSGFSRMALRPKTRRRSSGFSSLENLDENCTETGNKSETSLEIKKEPIDFSECHNSDLTQNSNYDSEDDQKSPSELKLPNQTNHSPETYLIDRYKYAVRHIKQGLSVEEACNKYRISKGALLKCLSGGTAPRGKKTRLTEFEENEIVEWLINYKDLKYNDAIHLVFEQVAQKFELAQRPNPFNNGKPSMDWWYDFLSRHPQIMASKPDWIMRGKVNDQYIRDVQSGHLKCTKFRRALLSAIQYIRDLNESIQTFDSDLFSTEKPTSQMTQKKVPIKPKSKKVRSSKRLLKQSCINQLENPNLKTLSGEDANSVENNEASGESPTFITEIFNSDLENTGINDFIDQNMLLDTEFKEEFEYDSAVYDMNFDNVCPLNRMLSNDFRFENSDLSDQNDSIIANNLSSSPILDSKNCFSFINNQRFYQHLLVPDDDDDENI
ncbi:hypothetical protein BpHYR1_000653 [Brachionus plicatilis]|uniref:HTH CENPB-type domain-containing protein n=1 Tax=Brachionus plicatilis TaxID=10195 RepID=A0A3M7SH17_BRAPC|nr:hypothetical protein BpHYR1_000653 [Brachionus plicatilis]